MNTIQNAPTPHILANSPTITCLISAYYAVPYLAGRIENLLQSNGVNLEIVVICQEGSEEEKIARDFTSSIVITSPANEPVPSVYSSWNAGIQNSTAPYITSANSDDRHFPDALAKLCEALEKHPSASVAYSNVNRVEKIDGEPIGYFEFMRGGLKELYWQGCFLGPMPVWRRIAHNRNGFFNEEYKSAGDYEFWLRLASNGEKFYHVEEILGDHLERPDSLEHKSAIRSAWEASRAKASVRHLVEK